MRLQVQTGRYRDGHVRLANDCAELRTATRKTISSAPPFVRSIGEPDQAGRDLSGGDDEFFAST
jgi:hypothetical protein